MNKGWIVIAALAAATGVAHAAESKADPADAQVDAVFAKLDGDGNGTLTRKEAARIGITKRAFEQANPDKDGTLDKKEFVAAIRWRFERANPDNDGTLDPKEAAKAGIKSKAAFQAANPDADGTLDLAEYLQALAAQVK